MKRTDLPLVGAFIIEPVVVRDDRGEFVKIYHADTYASKLGVQPNFVEEFYSISEKDVIRGMHFQRPPHDHAKLLVCLSGAVLDVILDLRRGSATFGKAVAVELSDANRRLLYLPSGFAHGFRAISHRSLMLYKTTAQYAATHDGGIRWDSFGFDWGLHTPVVSERDAALPPLSEFDSPFI